MYRETKNGNFEKSTKIEEIQQKTIDRS